MVPSVLKANPRGEVAGIEIGAPSRWIRGHGLVEVCGR